MLVLRPDPVQQLSQDSGLDRIEGLSRMKISPTMAIAGFYGM
jgi:hypothetical protein